MDGEGWERGYWEEDPCSSCLKTREFGRKSMLELLVGQLGARRGVEGRRDFRREGKCLPRMPQVLLNNVMGALGPLGLVLPATEHPNSY